MPASRIVLYSKPGCHLCDDMRAQLLRAVGATSIPVDVRNISDDLELFERYKHDVPVLVVGGREVARHRISDDALTAALRGSTP